MIHTLRRCLLIVLAALGVAAVVARAAAGTLSGTVQSLDPSSGQLTLRSEMGHVAVLQVPAALLTGLGHGDAVVVKVSVEKARPSGRRPLSPNPHR
jgi:hypothetical protein